MSEPIKKETKVIIIQESISISIIKDIFTFGTLMGCFWFVHQYVGGNWLAMFAVFVCFFIWAAGLSKHRGLTIEKAIEQLTEMAADS